MKLSLILSSYDFCRNFKTSIVNILLIVFISALQTGSGLQLDSDGGYHITVGLEKEISDPETATKYIANIQSNLKSLSTRITQASNQKFFLKAVTIVTTSALSDGFSISLSENFAESDIKISDAYLSPDVIRATQCEQPGEVIRLHTSFFDDTQDLLFKAKDKTLLHLWAQYRWGVFEESGYPGNSRFPYFTKKSADSDWEVSACSDKKLQGSIVRPDNSECDLNTQPDSECRFVVSDGVTNDARSSLMNNFYWISELDSFCTPETHNKLLHTKHNLFCENRSVKEVMESCPDWKKVSGTKIADTIFKIVKPSKNPLVYILLDNRVIPIPETEISKIKTEIKKLFDPTSGLSTEIVAAMGQYPGTGTNSFDQVHSWTVLSDGIGEFAGSIDSTVSQGEHPDELFGQAIKEISESIKSKRHEAGALILVFRSAPSSNYEFMTFEADVIGTLRTQKIKLFALEISPSALGGGENLKNVATLTGGSHLRISSSTDIEAELSEFIKDFILQSQSPAFKPASNIIFKDFISPDVPKSMKLFDGNVAQLQLTLTSAVDLAAVKFTSSSGDIKIVNVKEWNETYGKGRRIKFTGDITKPVLGEVVTVSYSCPVGTASCDALLTIESELIEGSDINEIKFSVPTGMTEFDFNGRYHLSEIFRDWKPLWSIGGREIQQLARIKTMYFYVPISKDFGKLEFKEQPLIDFNGQGVLKASATLCLQDNPRNCETISMTDNGAGIPDLLSNDGILSGIFVPSINGVYKCWVTASYQKSKRGSKITKLRKTAHSALFPCSIFNGEGECVGVVPPYSFQMMEDLPSVINVINIPIDLAPSVPTRIMDLEILYAQQYEVTLTWTSPSVFVKGGVDKVEKYEIRYCLENIMEVKDCILVDFTKEPSEPGLMETITVTMSAELVHYFIIRSVYKEQMSSDSNSVSQKPNENPVTSPIPSTDPSTDPATGTVPTEPPTVPTEPPTVPTDPPTEPPTVPTDPPTVPTEPPTVPTEPPTVPTEPPTVPTDPPTVPTEPQSTSISTTDSWTGSTNPDSNSTKEGSSTTISTSRTPATLPTTSIPTTETSEYFFKKPIGYITAATIGFVVFSGLCATVGYLLWKRHTIMKGRLLPAKTA